MHSKVIYFTMENVRKNSHLDLMPAFSIRLTSIPLWATKTMFLNNSVEPGTSVLSGSDK